MERGQLTRLLGEQEIQLFGITDADTAVEVGQMLDARQIIVGSDGLFVASGQSRTYDLALILGND